MKRTPPWVFIAAAGLQLAALGLCVWAMEQWRRMDRAPAESASEPAPSDEQPPPSSPPPAAPVPPPAPARTPAPPAPAPAPAPSRVTVAGTPVERAAYQMPADRGGYQPPLGGGSGRAAYAPDAARPSVRTVEPPPRPQFGPPPERSERDFGTNGFAEPAIPRFITEVADDTTQLVAGVIRDRAVTFGFYPDGNIRFVDVDGGRYGGKAESARARMREVDGLRAFTVQIGVAEDGRLQATFTGGLHDAATYPLEPLVGWSLA